MAGAQQIPLACHRISKSEKILARCLVQVGIICRRVLGLWGAVETVSSLCKKMPHQVHCFDKCLLSMLGQYVSPCAAIGTSFSEAASPGLEGTVWSYTYEPRKGGTASCHYPAIHCALSLQKMSQLWGNSNDFCSLLLSRTLSRS